MGITHESLKYAKHSDVKSDENDDAGNDDGDLARRREEPERDDECRRTGRRVNRVGGDHPPGGQNYREDPTRGEPEPRHRRRRWGRRKRHPGGERRIREETGDPADQMATDDTDYPRSLPPSLEREYKRRGPEAGENEWLATRPRDGSQDGEEQPSVQARPDSTTVHNGDFARPTVST